MDLILVRDTEIEEELGQTVCPVIEIPPGDVSASLGDRGHVGLHVGDRLPDVGVVPIRHVLFALIGRCFPLHPRLPMDDSGR
jgi:hypothetical protein